MFIALTSVNGWEKEEMHFMKDAFSEERLPPIYCSSSELKNPSILLKNLGLSNDYLESAPFHYIRSYAPIWEYYLVALNLSDPKMNGKIKDVYYNLRKIPSKEGCVGRYKGHIGNGKYEKWVKNYNQKINDENLKRKTKNFVNILIKKNCALRDYPINKKIRNKMIGERQKAASIFFNFLIKDTVEKTLIDKIIKYDRIEKQLKSLYEFFESKENKDSCKHILSISLLLCVSFPIIRTVHN